MDVLFLDYLGDVVLLSVISCGFCDGDYGEWQQEEQLDSITDL